MQQQQQQPTDLEKKFFLRQIDHSYVSLRFQHDSRTFVLLGKWMVLLVPASARRKMNDQKDAREGGEEENEGEKMGQRTYASYTRIAKLSFDPMKDLNLPGSYDEVLARFKRLQVIRAMEALN